MKKIWSPKLSEIMPESLLRDEKFKAAAQALDVELERLSTATREALHLPRLDELSGRILDFLAESLHIDFYEPLYLTEAEKKSLIRNSIAWHRIKGTVAAVEQIASSAWRDVSIEEPREFDDLLPYRFRIWTRGFKETPDGFATFLRMINASKNVRSWLDKIIIDYSHLMTPIKLFAGTAEAQVGTKIIGLERPHDERINLYAGAGNGVFGWKNIGLNQPESPPPNNLRLGQVDIKSGTIWLHADLSDLYKIPYIAENGTTEILVVDVGIVRPSDVPKKIERVANHIGQIYFRSGLITIGADMDDINRIPREDEHVVNHIGQVLVRRGEITIGADMSDVGLEHVVNHVGQIIVRQGEITIPTADRNIPSPVVNHVGQLNVRSGFMRIHADLSDAAKHNWIKEHGTANILVADIGIARPMAFRYTPVDPVEPDEALPSGLWLRNYFDFPTGADHPVLLQNPREDLTVADIKAVGDYAAANNLLFNSKAEGTLGIRKASLIRGYDMLTADDEQVFPATGKARLFFDFPNGNHRKIQLQNRRADLTVGDVKKFGATTTDNRILTNAHGEHSTGLTRVNIIRDFKINSLPPTTPITFEEDA